MFAVCLLLASAAAGRRQEAVRSFNLGTLQQAAIDTDPRLRQLQLLTQQADLRLRNISVERLPSIAIDGQAQYQSDVAHLPSTVPGIRQPVRAAEGHVRRRRPARSAALRHDGRRAGRARTRAARREPGPRPHDTLRAAAAGQRRVLCGGARCRRARARSAATIDDLEARLQETDARVRARHGIARRGAVIEATLLERQQDEDELQARRRAALARLGIAHRAAVADTDMLVAARISRQASADARQPPTTRPRAARVRAVRADARAARRQQDLADAPGTAARCRPSRASATAGRPELHRDS